MDGYIERPPGITKCPQPPLKPRLLGASTGVLFVRHLSCGDVATWMPACKCTYLWQTSKGYIHGCTVRTKIHAKKTTTHGRHTSFTSTAQIHIKLVSTIYHVLILNQTLQKPSWQGKSSSTNTQNMIWWPFGTTFLAWINICRPINIHFSNLLKWLCCKMAQDSRLHPNEA